MSGNTRQTALRFYHRPTRGHTGDFAQFDCMLVTLHFEFPDPFSDDHQHPVGAPCHRGSISPSGPGRNSGLELPETIFVLSSSLPDAVSRVYTGLKVLRGCKIGHSEVLLAIT